MEVYCQWPGVGKGSVEQLCNNAELGVKQPVRCAVIRPTSAGVSDDADLRAPNRSAAINAIAVRPERRKRQRAQAKRTLLPATLLTQHRFGPNFC